MRNVRRAPAKTRKPKHFWPTTKRLIDYLRPWKAGVIFSIFLAIVSVILSIIAPKILGEATLVSGQEDGGEAAADEEAVYTGDDYFASARLTRQQARDNAISLLQEAADQPGADTSVANEASEGIAVLAGYTMKEAQIENLVTAKGYADCVAFMGEDSISVVVDTGTGELTAEDVAKITDIAMTETGYPASGIKIMASN